MMCPGVRGEGGEGEVTPGEGDTYKIHHGQDISLASFPGPFLKQTSCMTFDPVAWEWGYWNSIISTYILNNITITLCGGPCYTLSREHCYRANNTTCVLHFEAVCSG